jgi:hypothetical protein
MFRWHLCSLLAPLPQHWHQTPRLHGAGSRPEPDDLQLPAPRAAHQWASASQRPCLVRRSCWEAEGRLPAQGVAAEGADGGGHCGHLHGARRRGLHPRHLWLVCGGVECGALPGPPKRSSSARIHKGCTPTSCRSIWQRPPLLSQTAPGVSVGWAVCALRLQALIRALCLSYAQWLKSLA